METDIARIAEILANISTSAIFLALYVYERKKHEETRAELTAFLKETIARNSTEIAIQEAKQVITN